MSKQVLINERDGGSIGMGGDDWPKASIGNYKGVMLCNRPNDVGQAARPEREGNQPFRSRVYPPEPLGWNPSKKLQPRVTKKKGKSRPCLGTELFCFKVKIEIHLFWERVEKSF